MALWNWSRVEPRWSFVIDTDSYAGNFERELCAYVTGHCDEYGGHRSGRYKALYEEELPHNPFQHLIDYRVDDHGDDQINRAPMSLAPTPGYGNDGHGNHKKLSFGESAKHPAYQSVAIFLRRKPTYDELRVLVLRANTFPALPKEKPWDHRPAILGCRLVEELTTLTSTPVHFEPNA